MVIKGNARGKILVNRYGYQSTGNFWEILTNLFIDSYISWGGANDGGGAGGLEFNLSA